MDKEDVETLIECIETIEDIEGVECSSLKAEIHLKVEKDIVPNEDTWHTIRERKVSEEEISNMIKKLQDQVRYVGTVDAMNDYYDEDRIDFYYR